MRSKMCGRALWLIRARARRRRPHAMVSNQLRRQLRRQHRRQSYLVCHALYTRQRARSTRKEKTEGRPRTVTLTTRSTHAGVKYTESPGLALALGWGACIRAGFTGHRVSEKCVADWVDGNSRDYFVARRTQCDVCGWHTCKHGGKRAHVSGRKNRADIYSVRRTWV